MYFTKTAIAELRSQIHAHLADATQAMRVAEKKLAAAARHSDDGQEKADLMAAQHSVKVFADLIESIGDGKPTHAGRVFRSISRHTNQQQNNTPHVEAAILALTLAERSLTAALDLAGQLDGDAIDDFYQIPYAARGVVNTFTRSIVCWSYVFPQEQILDAILAGKRPAVRQRRAALVAA